ncbi:BspA family leucine-rich repeat surface protein, partial [Adlercreutzia caecimuris]
MRTRVKQPLKFKNVFLRGALALLLAIACVPAEAIASGSQAWGSTWGYAAIYQKVGDDGYALVLQSSPSADTSYGRLVQCEPATDSGLLVGDIEMQHAITEVIVRDTLRPSGLPHAFAYLDQCTSMDLSKLDTSSVTDMSNMFERCSSLTSLDLGSFDTSSVTDMG